MFTPRTLPLALTLVAILLCATPPAAAEPPADLELQLVIPGLVQAVALRHAGDGSGRLFVVEKPGRIWVWDGSSTPPTMSLFLGLTNRIVQGPEQGLLGLEFHPDYTENDYLYVNYTESEPDPAPDCGQAQGSWNTAIERYRVSADPDLADPDSALRVLTVNQDFANHNGGNLLFGPDGHLYVGMGDGGSGGDPCDRAQDPGSLLGKMLRLDVDGDDFPDPGRNYAIPPDNPFVGAAGRDEIWAYGLRNPWRWSFDRVTGDLFLGDVGQNAVEEIDLQPASSGGGENFGWDCKEGSSPFPGGSTCTGSVVDPILEYGHALGCAVTGGYRYRGHRIVGFQGTYVYADYCTGRIWLGTEDAMGGWSSSEWPDAPPGLNVTSFGEDEAGELYVVDLNAVYRFVSPSSIFTDGFESGDTSAW